MDAREVEQHGVIENSHDPYHVSNKRAAAITSIVSDGRVDSRNLFSSSADAVGRIDGDELFGSQWHREA